MKFEGTRTYVATEDLRVAVNAAITLERPLLVKGEPGTGKTVLAIEVAEAISAPLIEWHIKSTTKAQQGLYEYDAVSRLRDSQLGDERVQDIRNYIKRGKLWDAFDMDARPVLLIDEIDKADIEFPNDLLQELDRMEFFVYETGETVQAAAPADRDHHLEQREGAAGRLPAPLLLPLHQVPRSGHHARHHRGALPRPEGPAGARGAEGFLRHSRRAGLKKKPSTSELLDWIKLLLSEDISPETLREKDPRKMIPPLHGALVKNEQDVHLFERLAFMTRRQQGG